MLTTQIRTQSWALVTMFTTTLLLFVGQMVVACCLADLLKTMQQFDFNSEGVIFRRCDGLKEVWWFKEVWSEGRQITL